MFDGVRACDAGPSELEERALDVIIVSAADKSTIFDDIRARALGAIINLYILLLFSAAWCLCFFGERFKVVGGGPSRRVVVAGPCVAVVGAGRRLKVERSPIPELRAASCLAWQHPRTRVHTKREANTERLTYQVSR